MHSVAICRWTSLEEVFPAPPAAAAPAQPKKDFAMSWETLRTATNRDLTEVLLQMLQSSCGYLNRILRIFEILSEFLKFWKM